MCATIVNYRSPRSPVAFKSSAPNTELFPKTEDGKACIIDDDVSIIDTWRAMTKLPQDLDRDFATLTAEAQQSVVAKLRRYVARGHWAEAQLRLLGLSATDGAGP